MAGVNRFEKLPTGVGGWQETEKKMLTSLMEGSVSLDKWRQAWKTEETSRRRVLTSKNATPQSYDFTGSSAMSNYGVLFVKFKFRSFMDLLMY